MQMKKLTKNQKEAIVNAANAIADLRVQYKKDKLKKEREFEKVFRQILEKRMPLRTLFKKKYERKCGYVKDPSAIYMILRYYVSSKDPTYAIVRTENFIKRHVSFLYKKVDSLGRPNGYSGQIWWHHFEECYEIVK